MMALAAYAQHNGIFDTIAAHAVRLAGASRQRLFVLVYASGIVTTTLLSNDATIVALTPAVIAALRRYDAAPLPYVVACALIANAASFVLPISNPSNLLVFAGHMPALGAWLHAFILPSIVSIAVTFGVLWLLFRTTLHGEAQRVDDGVPAFAPLPAAALLLAVAVLVAVSALHGPLGLATFACGAFVWILTVLRDRTAARTIAGEISWRIVALTAVLFVVIGAIDGAGGIAASRALLVWCAHLPGPLPALTTGFASAVASNVINNLPVGLSLGETLHASAVPDAASAAALVGVNLGPNATLHGSLATLLWLRIVRRADIAVSPWSFLRVGALCAVPALVAALLVT